MKIPLKKLLPLIIAAVILLCFTAVLAIYTTPMENVSLDLSLTPPEGAIPGEYDDKGWTVYTQEGDVVTELTPDGLGGYTGLEPGQTIYFSRLMTEYLDTPTLQLGIVDRTFSIFLDGELVYTDCPPLDNRIGHLQLPTRQWEVPERLTISLPTDFRGKVLTIAQSTPVAEGSGRYCAYPTETRLYCGYSYESELIAESFSAAILATLLFLVGVLLLASFVRFSNPRALCMALVAFLWMTSVLCSLSFFSAYVQNWTGDIVTNCRLLSILVLLIYLTLQCGRAAKAMWLWTGLCALSLIVHFVTAPETADPILSFLRDSLQEWMLMAGLLAAISLCAANMRRDNLFCNIFVPLTLVTQAVCWIIQCLLPGRHVWEQICLDIQSGGITFLYRSIAPLVIASALVAAFIQVFHREILHRTEKQLLEKRREMTLASYENLRRQHEEVMIIRHDMVRHFRALRAMTDQSQISTYLDDILGQINRVRTVVHSGNETLDIILNSRLGEAMDAGIAIDIVRTEVPQNLPLSDADLCSLVMNITDNALHAAAASQDPHPFIRLDVHVKSNFMVLICENSNAAHAEEEEKTQTVPKHGLGLKIIRSIAQKYEGLVDIESDELHYQVRVAIPLI